MEYFVESRQGSLGSYEVLVSEYHAYKSFVRIKHKIYQLYGINIAILIFMSILKLIGRDKKLFSEDVDSYASKLVAIVSNSSFLVLGGAGSIGQAVVKEIFIRNPKKLHVVDISENNMVELVRDIRSSFGYIDGDFQTFALDIGSVEYDAFIAADGKYDYVLNLSALKHVRSEKDAFTLMRMIDVNIFNTDKTIAQATQKRAKK